MHRMAVQVVALPVFVSWSLGFVTTERQAGVGRYLRDGCQVLSAPHGGGHRQPLKRGSRKTYPEGLDGCMQEVKRLL